MLTASSKSDEIAIKQYDDIEVILQKILSNNIDITARLQRVEESLTSNSRVDSVRSLNLHDSSGSDQDVATNRQSILAVRWSIAKFSFESDLEQSRAYRKATRDTMDFSFRSSVVGSHAWSTLSDISLSNISMIAVVALPVFSSDINNSQHYSFGKFYEQIEGVHDDLISPPNASAGHVLYRRHKALNDASTLDTTNDVVSVTPMTRYLEKFRFVIVGPTDVGKSDIVSQVSMIIHLKHCHVAYMSVRMW